MVEMRQAMAAVSMKKDDDPISLFEQISGTDNRFQNAALTMSDEEKIATILMAAPKEYITLLPAQQRQKGANFKLDDLQEAMLAQLRQTHNITSQNRVKEQKSDWLPSQESVTTVRRQDTEQTTALMKGQDKDAEDAAEEAAEAAEKEEDEAPARRTAATAAK
jgi:hypothetical protein